MLLTIRRIRLPQVGRKQVETFLTVAIGLGIAFFLKAFYSQASANELRWILAPTTSLASLLTGAEFEWEPHGGYLCRSLLFEIVPSCAGVNFLIAAFSSLTCGLTHLRPTLSSKVCFLGLSGVLAYLLTILANAIRIALVLPLHSTHLSIGPLDPERLHLMAGVIVYTGLLGIGFAVVSRWARGENVREH